MVSVVLVESVPVSLPLTPSVCVSWELKLADSLALYTKLVRA
jgi:hypothetical protein